MSTPNVKYVATINSFFLKAFAAILLFKYSGVRLIAKNMSKEIVKDTTISRKAVVGMLRIEKTIVIRLYKSKEISGAADHIEWGSPVPRIVIEPGI